MDTQQIEILEQNRGNFLQTVDPERILPFLKEDEVLDVNDIARINAFSSPGERLETMLDMLPGKGAQAFSTFCLAVENTYPQLLTLMLRSQHQGHEIPPARPHMQDPVTRSSPRQEKPPPIPPMPVGRSESYGRGDAVVRTESFTRNEPTRRSESFGKGEQKVIPRNDSFTRNDTITRNDSFGRTDPINGDTYVRSDPNSLMRTESIGRGDHFSRSDSFRNTEAIRRNDSFTRTEPPVRAEPFSRNDSANRSDSFGRGDAAKRMNFARSDPTRRSESFGRSDHSQEQMAMMRAHHASDAAKQHSRTSHGQDPQGHSHRSSHGDRKADSSHERRHHGQDRQSHAVDRSHVQERSHGGQERPHVQERSHGQERHHNHDRHGSDSSTHTSTLERKPHPERTHSDRQHLSTDSGIADRRSHESSTLERRSKGDRRGHHGSDSLRHPHSQDMMRGSHERTHSKESAPFPNPSLIPDRIPKMPAQHPHSLEPLPPMRKSQEVSSKTRMSAGKLPSPLDRSPCNPEPPPLPSQPPPNMAQVKESRGATILEDEEGTRRSPASLLGFALPKPTDESHVSPGPPRSYTRPVSVQEYTTNGDHTHDVSLLRAEIKLSSSDRDELALAHANYKRSTMNPDLVKPASEKVTNHNYDWLKSQCDSAMRELHQLRQQHGETVKRCNRAMEDADRNRQCYRTTKEENDQYRTEIMRLKAEWNQASSDKDRLEKEVVELKIQLEDDKREMVQLRKQQKDAMSENGSAADNNLSVLYNTYVNRYDALKQEYDMLKSKLSKALQESNSANNRSDLLQDRNDKLRKDFEVLENECKRQKSHMTAAIQNHDREKSDLLKELQDAKLERDRCKIERDAYKRQIGHATAEQIKTTKDYGQLKKERDAVVHEYTLIMSERDTVHKEIEQAQDKYTDYKKRNELLEKDKKSAAKQLDGLQAEIAAAHQERDRAIKQYKEIKERLGGSFPDVMEMDMQRETLRKEVDKMRSELELHRDSNKRGVNAFDRSMKDITDGKESENLRKEVERLQTDLTDAVQEAYRAKEDREWAFRERDKIVKERESVRTLCDRLRHEREDAVRKLIEAVRDSDELKKQKSDALKELKETKDKYEALVERETRKNQLHAIGHNHSRDSAIDADLQEWETETVELEIRGVNADDLGFELTRFGREDAQIPYDCLVVSGIRQDSIAYGKLKTNDQLIRVNGVDVTSGDRSQLLQTIKQGGTNVNMVVRRRKLASTRAVFSVTINLSPDREIGINLEQGLYVSRIVTGSAAAREGNLAVGDRILYVNDTSVENMSAADVLRSALESDRITFSVVKYCLTPQPSIASSSSMSSAQAFTESSPEASSVSPRSPHSNSRFYITPSPDSADDKVPSSTNLKNSCGSQTDSLDSPKPGSKQRQGEPEPNKMTIIDKAVRAVIKPFRSSCATDRNERDSRCQSGEQFHKAPIIEPDIRKDEDDVIATLNNIISDYSQQSPITSPGVVPTMASKPSSKSSHVKDKEHKESKRRRRETSGTWPKCNTPIDANSSAAWPRVVPKKERAPIPEFVRDTRYESSPKSPSPLVEKVPPRPPERSDSFHRSDSFKRSASVKHSPQNSDSGVKMAYINKLTSNSSSYVSSPPSQDTSHSHSASQDSTSSRTHAHSTSQPHVTDKVDVRGSSSSQRDHAQDVKEHVSSHEGEKKTSSHFSTSSESSTPTHSSHTPDLSVRSGNESDILKYITRKTKDNHRNRPTSAPGRSRRRPQSGAEMGYRDYPQKPTSLDIQPMYSPRPIPNSRGQAITSSHSSVPPSQSLSPMGRSVYVPSPRSMSPREMSPAYINGKSQPYSSSPAPCQVISSSNPPVYVAGSRPASGGGFISPPAYPGSHMVGSIPEIDSHHNPLHNMYQRGGRHEVGRYNATPSPSPSQQSGSLDDFHQVPPHHLRSRPPHGRHSADIPPLDRRPPFGDRMRIPSSTISVSSRTSSSVGGISSSSYDQMSSDRGSPISPPFWPADYTHTPGISSSLPINRPKKPGLGEKRDIKVEKGSENLGIQIECGCRGGIFVSSVSDNSLASKAGLAVGDQLLEVCGINMRGATKDLAASVLRQCGGSVNMRVQYNPDKYHGEVTSSTDNESSGDSPSATPSRLRKAPHRISNETITPDTCSPTSLSPSTLSPTHSAAISGENFPTPCDPRTLILKKSHSQDELGLNIAGGNSTGIFVQTVIPNSIAARNGGLRCGDQILMMNGVYFRNITAEQASIEISKPTDNYLIKLVHNQARFDKLNSMPWDDIYVRALIDRPSQCDGELDLQKGDVLWVDSTLYQGRMGTWWAWLVDDKGNKVRGGTVPSKSRVEEELVCKRSLSEADDELKGSRRGSASARRSFFRRKKHQRNNSKDSREFNSFSDASINSDSVPFLADDGSVLTFERVERLDSSVYRPVLILGPLADPLVSKLNSESPDRYCRVAPEVVKATMASMETGQEDGDIIDFKPLADSQFECLSMQAIKDIIDKNRYAMLVLHPSTIERLHKTKIYPVVLFIKHKSAKQIREVKDTRFWPEKMTNKNAKELFETFAEVEQKFKRFFSDVIPGGNLAMMGFKIKSAIDKEQKKTVWVPSGSL